MNQTNDISATSVRYHPLKELVLARLREFYREPEAIFWVYGFPLVLAVALGIAFRNKPVENITVDVQDGPKASEIYKVLMADPEKRFKVQIGDEATTTRRLRTGKTELVVIPRVLGAASQGEPPVELRTPGVNPSAPPLIKPQATLQFEFFYDPIR